MVIIYQFLSKKNGNVKMPITQTIIRNYMNREGIDRCKSLKKCKYCDTYLTNRSTCNIARVKSYRYLLKLLLHYIIAIHYQRLNKIQKKRIPFGQVDAKCIYLKRLTIFWYVSPAFLDLTFSQSSP